MDSWIGALRRCMWRPRSPNAVLRTRRRVPRVPSLPLALVAQPRRVVLRDGREARLSARRAPQRRLTGDLRARLPRRLQQRSHSPRVDQVRCRDPRQSAPLLRRRKLPARTADPSTEVADFQVHPLANRIVCSPLGARRAPGRDNRQAEPRTRGLVDGVRAGSLRAKAWGAQGAYGCLDGRQET